MKNDIIGVDIKLKNIEQNFGETIDDAVIRMLKEFISKIEKEGLKSNSITDKDGNLIGLLAVRTKHLEF